MHRIAREDLRLGIAVAIQTMREGRLRSQRHPMPEFRDAYLVDMLTARILTLIDGESRMVIATEMKANSYGSHNKWGVEEPWPPGCEPGANNPLPPTSRSE
jgi:hypothetical protein